MPLCVSQILHELDRVLTQTARARVRLSKLKIMHTVFTKFCSYLTQNTQLHTYQLVKTTLRYNCCLLWTSNENKYLVPYVAKIQTFCMSKPASYLHTYQHFARDQLNIRNSHIRIRYPSRRTWRKPRYTWHCHLSVRQSQFGNVSCINGHKVLLRMNIRCAEGWRHGTHEIPHMLKWSKTPQKQNLWKYFDWT